MSALELDNKKIYELTDDQFFDFCCQNKNLRIERDANKSIVIMSPTFFKTGKWNSEINFQLTLWNKSKKAGVVVDSNAGFYLKNGAMRSPDASWISNEQYNSLTEKDKNSFPHICPLFVVELRSATDNLKTLQNKMEEWMDSGCALAWLIDAENKQVFIYRKNKPFELYTSWNTLSGENVLIDFVLDLTALD